MFDIVVELRAYAQRAQRLRQPQISTKFLVLYWRVVGALSAREQVFLQSPVAK